MNPGYLKLRVGRHLGWLLYPLAAAAAAAVVCAMVAGAKHYRTTGQSRTVQREDQFARTLQVWLEKGMHGQFDQAVAEIRSLPERDRSRRNRYAWSLALARLFHHAAATATPTRRDSYLENSRLLYLRAVANSEDVAAERVAKLALLRVSMDAGRPESALAVIESMLRQTPGEQEERDLHLLAVRCHEMRKDWIAAGREADLAIGADSAGELATDALVAKGEVLFAAGAGAASAAAFVRAQPEVEAAARAEPEAWTRRAARRCFEEALARMPMPDARRAAVLNHLLEVCIRENDTASAYRYVHALKNTLLPPDERVRAYQLVARLEEQNQRGDAAIEVLRLCLEEFPSSPKAIDAYLNLFRLLWCKPDPKGAVTALRQLVQRFGEVEVLSRAIDALRTAAESAAADPPASDGPAPWREPVRDLLALCEQRLERQGGTLLARNLIHARAILEFRAGDLELAEQDTALCLSGTWLREKDEESLLYQDLLCAVNLQRPATTQAYRANRYLHRFPGGSHRQEVMSRLIRAYGDMGLHQAAIGAARAAFIAELLTAHSAGSGRLGAAGLNTVTKVAQCYTKLGFFDKANRLFRLCFADPDMTAPTEAAVLDWAATAAGVSQLQEAGRRLTVGCELMQTPEARQRLGLARDLHSLATGDVEAAVFSLPGRTQVRQSFPWAAAGDLSRRRFDESVLQGLYTHKRTDFHAEVARLIPECARESWFEPWLLRDLALRLGEQPAAEVVQWARTALTQGADAGAAPTGPLSYLAQQTSLAQRLAKCDRDWAELQQRGLTP